MTASCRRVLNWNHLFTKIIIVLFFLYIFISMMTLPVLQALASNSSHQNINMADHDFPVYPSIQPNIDFWVAIFTEFSKSQGLIHDSQNPGIVYDIIRLDTSETLRGNRKNRKTIKFAIKKYKKILLSLSKGKKILSKIEKQVAALFAANTKPHLFKIAAFNIRCQSGLKEQFKEGLIRSGLVMDEIKRIFKSHGLPADLIYLPCVESSYNFKAYSKFGAAGIWQFTRSTGRQYMKINYVVDERRDPYISTDAAARLLKKNYAELKDWPLAITAYNHGRAGMMRAKKLKGSYEKIIKSYRSRSFKFASRNFYSEFLAARIVAKNPQKYYGDIKLKKPAVFQIIKTKGHVPVKELSRGLNISFHDIWALNPSLRKPVFTGQKYIPRGFYLKLPKNLIPGDIRHHLAKIYRKQQKPSLFHRVQKGDTAGSIARLHSVKLQDLVLANGLNRRATIYIGQNLRIPVKGEIVLAQKKIKKKNIKAPAIIKKVPKPLPVPSLPAKPIKEEPFINPNIVTADLKVKKIYLSGSQTIGEIRVAPEETLGHYADWLKIHTRKIRALNKFKYGEPISIHQKIKIPLATKTTMLKFEEQRYEFHKEIEEDFFESFFIQGIETYKVKSGDSIWGLCLNTLEVPYWLIKKYNPDINFDGLLPGQEIKYPILNKHLDPEP